VKPCHELPTSTTLLSSSPSTSNHPGREGILTPQVLLAFSSEVSYSHCVLLSGFTAFPVGFNNIQGRPTFIALRNAFRTPKDPHWIRSSISEAFLSKHTFRCPFICSEREEGIVCGSLAGYLQPPQSAHLFRHGASQWICAVQNPDSEYSN